MQLDHTTKTEVAREDQESAIEITDVWEKYRLYRDKTSTLKEFLVSFKRATYEEFWALKGVTFDVKKGEVFGIIGVNGSGKSTLLKCIARTIVPTRGQIITHGKVSALLEVGAGFHPELSGRENVYINGAILGMSRREIRKRFDDIVTFAGLEQFIDMPVRSYSSGMYMRLGFSVAVHVDPEILLIDEVLAVGDQEFQIKCKEKIDELRIRGKTILFVSHSLAEVRRLCKMAIWLDGGSIRTMGPVEEVADAYMKEVNDRLVKAAEDQASDGQGLKDSNKDSKSDPEKRWGTGEIEIESFEFVDDDGKVRSTFRTGENLKIRIKYKAHKKIQRPVFGFSIFRPSGMACTASSTRLARAEIDSVEGEGIVECRTDDLTLLAGFYLVSPYIDHDSGLKSYDVHDKLYEFKVLEGKYSYQGGVYQLPCTWHHVRD